MKSCCELIFINVFFSNFKIYLSLKILNHICSKRNPSVCSILINRENTHLPVKYIFFITLTESSSETVFSLQDSSSKISYTTISANVRNTQM